MMIESASNTDKPIQIEIFPSRLLKPETAEKLLTQISELDGVCRAFVQGPRLPQSVPYGPAKGKIVEHKFHKTILVGDAEITLSVMVGSLRMEILDEFTKNKIREICERVLPMGFEFREGLFIQRRQTVSDYAKRGPDADPLYLGMADPKGKVGDRITILKKTE